MPGRAGLDRMPAYRSMTRAALDAAYNNSAAVADSARRIETWTERTRRLRAERSELLDLAYGPAPRSKLDLYRSGRPEAPLLAFIHGGYWQRNSKDVFGCMAEGLLQRGVDAAVIGYTLAPDASLRAIEAEIAAAIVWLRSAGPRIGVARGALVVAGWSAGGHLTARAMDHAGVTAGLAISGIFDLEPIRASYINDKLRLDARDAAALSPIGNPPPRSGPLTVAVGTAELPELQRQSRDFHAAWAARGLPVSLLAAVGKDHFSILDELASPTGLLAEEVLRLARAGGADR